MTARRFRGEGATLHLDGVRVEVDSFSIARPVRLWGTATATIGRHIYDTLVAELRGDPTPEEVHRWEDDGGAGCWS